MNPRAEAFTSFRELDQTWATPKGAAFRAFKQALPILAENRDFIRLDANHDHAEIESLRAAGRIYAGSVHVVLISRTSTNKLRRP